MVRSLRSRKIDDTTTEVTGKVLLAEKGDSDSLLQQNPEGVEKNIIFILKIEQSEWKIDACDYGSGIYQ